MLGFGKKLKVLREKAGISQEELASRAGIHRVQVNRLEAETSVPSWPTVQAIAKALGVSCEVFQESPAPPAGKPKGKGRKKA